MFWENAFKSVARRGFSIPVGLHMVRKKLARTQTGRRDLSILIL